MLRNTSRVIAAGFLMLFCSLIACAQDYSISGRVIDMQNRPVPAAIVFHLALSRRSEAAKVTAADAAVADRDGRFRFEGADPDSLDRVIYVGQREPVGVFLMRVPPFASASAMSDATVGRAFRIEPGKDLDLGDIHSQVDYHVVSLSLRGRDDSRLPKEMIDTRKIRVRVRDFRGDIVADGGLGWIGVDAPAISDDGTLRVALPQGRWSIEAAIRDENRRLRSAPASIVLGGDDHEAAILNLKLDQQRSAYDDPSPQIDSRQALEALAAMGLAFEPQTFSERAERGNTTVLRLFLAAGMDIDAHGEDGVTALMRSSRYVETVSFLLSRGAKVDLKSDAGSTALIVAAAEGHTESLQALLRAGADPNIASSTGRTALMLAAGSNHADVVELLLKAGADPFIRDEEDKSALDYATIVGAQDRAIGLLIKEAQKHRKPLARTQ